MHGWGGGAAVADSGVAGFHPLLITVLLIMVGGGRYRAYQYWRISTLIVDGGRRSDNARYGLVNSYNSGVVHH